MARVKRTKTLTMDGATLTFSPLTIDQIEEYVKPLENLAGSSGKIRSYDLIMHGLNNALPDDAPETDRWTHDRIRKELDLPLFEKLQFEILKLSGFNIDMDALKTTGAAETATVGVPGESNAASAGGNSLKDAGSSQSSTSATSVAA